MEDAGRQNLKERGYRIKLLTGFMNECEGWRELDLLAKMYVLYSELMLSTARKDDSEKWNENKLFELKYGIERVREIVGADV